MTSRLCTHNLRVKIDENLTRHIPITNTHTHTHTHTLVALKAAALVFSHEHVRGFAHTAYAWKLTNNSTSPQTWLLDKSEAIQMQAEVAHILMRCVCEYMSINHAHWNSLNEVQTMKYKLITDNEIQTMKYRQWSTDNELQTMKYRQWNTERITDNEI